MSAERGWPCASRSAAVAVVIFCLVATGCGSDTGDSPSPSPAPVVLTVFAAASLTELFNEIGPRFETTHTGTNVVFSFGGSSALARQIVNGAPADVLATADETSLDIAGSAGRLGPSRVFATNRLVIAVGRGNPKGIRTLADLAQPGLVVVLCAVEVPCGRLGASALAKAGVDVRPASLEPDVKAVVAKVALGEADAGIAYVTDVGAGSESSGSESGIDGVAIADELNEVTRYPAAVVRSEGVPDGAAGDRRRRQAQAFVDFLVTSDTARLVASFGFGPR